jgi:MoxR-like ATPase
MTTELASNENTSTAVATVPAVPLSTTFKTMRDELADTYFERLEIATGAICAVLSRTHMFVLGPAGTAKSALIRDMCQRITGADYFEWLLSKYTTPEDIFGPLSLSMLKQDRAVRDITGKAPSAHIAFLDEVFKANSSILNAQLAMMNERVFFNDGKPNPVPLESMFGASNELPDSEELAPFYDRFLLRYTARYISDDGNFKKMLEAVPLANTTTLDLNQLKVAQAEAAQVTISSAMMDELVEIRKKALANGIIASDRRYKQSLQVLKAHAYLYGRTAVTEDDLTMLSHILPDNDSQYTAIRKIVIEVANPVMSKVQELLDDANDVRQKGISAINNADEDELPTIKASVGTENTIKFKEILDELTKIKDTQEANGRGTDMIMEAIKEVKKLQADNIKETYGFSFEEMA